MSESTPLLPQISRPPRDYSVFYRVCHSPWPFVPPRALLAARMSLAVFISVVLILDLVYDITYTGTGKVYAFRLSHIGLFIQLLYFSLTSWWTYSYFGDSSTAGGLDASYDSARRRSSIRDAGQRMLAVRHTTKNLNGALFSLFYTISNTVPFVVTILAWLVLFPGDPSALGQTQHSTKQVADDKGPLRVFCLIATHSLNSFVALVEIMLLSSVKRQHPIPAHIVGLLLVCATYTVWVFFGKLVTGEYAYKHLDPAYAGAAGVIAGIVYMWSLTIMMFFLQYGLHSLRQTLVKRMEKNRNEEWS